MLEDCVGVWIVSLHCSGWLGCLAVLDTCIHTVVLLSLSADAVPQVLPQQLCIDRPVDPGLQQ